MNLRPILALLSLLCLALPAPVRAQAARIAVDGDPSDWERLEPAHTDPSGDGASGTTDFGRLWCANDDNFLFLRLEVGGEINLQEPNRLTLYFDADDDPGTGIPVGDMGADLAWTFGELTGAFTTSDGTLTIGHDAIGLVTAPTVSASDFEIALDRRARPDGVTPLFRTATVRIAIGNGEPGGDTLPDTGSVRYAFDESPLPPIEMLTLEKIDPDHVRILSYNVSFDGPFDPNRVDPYTRLFQAIRPDIIGIQEMYDHSAAETLNRIGSMLPLPPGEQWYASKVPPDIVAVSRFRIVLSFNIEGNGAFVLDLRPRYDGDLLLIVAHPPCCQSNRARQLEVDAIMAFVRDARERGGLISLVPGTPMLLMGDFNLVGFSQQLRTLLTGEIVNTSLYGPSFAPDWDETGLADGLPRHPSRLMTYTWRDAASAYPPGRLDYLIYTDAVVQPANRFVLFTGDLSDEVLVAHGLHRTDAAIASDHIPLVVDFMVPVVTRTEGGRPQALATSEPD